ncbi:MAG TPA: TerB family tellurite resistance protein [Solimonas sp.]|nr:TerB family tellurite resistance protein [Solimonas sp.]
MWQRLSRILQQPAPPDADARRRLALAVLLLETARADFAQEPAEIEAVRRELGRHFGVPPAELDALLQQAGQRAREAVSLHEFVAALNAGATPEERAAMIAMLWRVAYADGRLDPHEEHLVRRLAELLHVPHAVFIREKLAAR